VSEHHDGHHAGEQLGDLRTKAGLTVGELAARAGVDPGWVAQLEEGIGTGKVPYHQWAALVRATQPPRPSWWDEGHEHDLSLPAGGHRKPQTESGRAYWARIEAVRAGIEEHYSVAEPPDLEPQIAELCRVLNHYGVRYGVFGSQVGASPAWPSRRSTSTSSPSPRRRNSSASPRP